MNTPLLLSEGSARFLKLNLLFFVLSFFAFLNPVAAQTEVVCADGPVNDTFCYDNDNTITLSFQSDTGFPLRLVFNSGGVENSFDELIVLDSDGITNLNEDNPYGDDGDLTGFTFTSTGDLISFTVASDFTVSCATGDVTTLDFDVFCLECSNPEATFTVVQDCDNSTDFTVDVDITDLGTASSVTVVDDQGSAPQTLSTTGIVTFGPYPQLTDIVLTINNDDDVNCSITSEALSSFCLVEGACEIVEAGEDTTLDCGELCIDLEARVIAFPETETTSYTINGPLCDIPPVDGGTPTNLVIDDQWSSVVDLSFTFNFFGNDYTQIVVGANGQISFNTALSGQGNNWPIDPEDLIPVDDTSFPLNTIYGAFHDMDPSVNPDPDRLNYFVIGDAPFRIFVLNFNTVPHFGGTCNDAFFTTQQILLYETLNVVDVNLVDKPACEDWNNGLAVVGLMGNDLTEFSVPPTRNTGFWTAQNESWRFVPDGQATPNAGFEWQDAAGNTLSTDLEFNVCPTVETTYFAVLTYNGSTGVEVFTDEITITPSNSDFSMELPEDQSLCDETSYEIIPQTTGDITGATYLWSTGETTPTITVTDSDEYILDITVGPCILRDVVAINFGTSPLIELGNDLTTCFEEEITLDATPSNYDVSEVSFQWRLNGTVITGETGPTISVNQLGTYGAIVIAGDCTSVDSVIISPSDDIAIDLGEDFQTCFVDTITLDASPTNYDPSLMTYEWSYEGEVMTSEVGSTLNATQVGTYSVLVTFGVCSAEDAITITEEDAFNIDLGSDFRSCPNEIQTLTAVTDQTDVTYEWYADGALIDGATQSEIQVTIPEDIGSSFTYRVVISRGICSSEAEVTAFPYDIGNCVISQGLSPNGSVGMNDSMDLEFLADRTGGITKLQIFNRLGAIVFEKSNYVKEWVGQDNSGNELTTGTYFYVIDFLEADPVYGPQATGWIYLNRESN